MGVYIPNIKMPNSCGECLFICKESTCRYGKGYERADFCPLIEVTPHGRLIDADVLLEEVYKLRMGLLEINMPGAEYWVTRVYQMIDEMPTIIEVEDSFFNSLKRGLEQAINDDVREITISEAEVDE